MMFLSRAYHPARVLWGILIVVPVSLILPATAANLDFSSSLLNTNTAAIDSVQLQISRQSTFNSHLIQLAAMTDGSMGGDGTGGMGGGAIGGAIQFLDAGNVTLRVRKITRTMHDGANILFWVFCPEGMGDGGGCTLPSPVLELRVGQQANVVLDMMMAPVEPAPYDGHTIHHHGLDVNQAEDGVPDTGAAVNGDTYNFSVDSRYVGGHMYHCHVHTVKHLEMGMYGAFIVKDGNRINANGPTYDYEWNIVMSTVDPRYHESTAIMDSTVFADYRPKYFLLNGNEGLSTSSPADTFTAAPGANVAIRLIGLHSVNSVFKIKNGSGSLQQFVVHNMDGFKLTKPQLRISIELSPGQTKDIMVTLPDSGGSWFPQISYTDLRSSKEISGGTVYTRLDF